MPRSLIRLTRHTSEPRRASESRQLLSSSSFSSLRLLHAARGFLLVSGLTLFSFSFSQAAAPDRQPAETDSKSTEPAARPNFVLCMTDDQGWGDVGYNGHPTLKTPVLDEMARTGLRFDRFYSASSVCSPTRGSLLTGRNPNRFGCFSWGYPIRAEEATIAEALQAAGYATGHFGKWHLGEVLAGAPNSPGGSGFQTWLSAPNFFDNNPLLSKNGRVIQTQGESSLVAMDAALEFIQSARQKEQPFLAVVWFGSPHTPHEGWPEIKKLYANLSPAKQNYYAEITGVDQALGKLRNSLRDMGLAENTVLWFNSDNGPQGGGRGMGSAGDLRGRKGSLWEGGIRVPAIIEWPAEIKKPRVTEVAASTMDIYPTVLALAGVKVKEQPVLDGESLVGVIEGTEASRETPIGFWDYPIHGRGKNSQRILAAWMAEQAAGREVRPAKVGPIKPLPLDALPGHAAWMEGAWKLHKIAGKDGAEQHHLYNLETDREESKDLASAEPARIKQMLAHLIAWQKSVIRSQNGEDYNKQSSAVQTEPAAKRKKTQAENETQVLFDGKTLRGWEGSEKMFRVEDGAIVAGSLKQANPHNEFLCTKRPFENFELRLKVKVVPNSANAGVQFRSERIPNHFEVSGYQADMGQKWWGKLYDESRRKKILVDTDLEKLAKDIHVEDWNEYVIRCEGHHIQLFLNGVPTVDYTEPDKSLATKGIIGLQIHSGPPAEAYYKDITIKVLK